MLLLKLLLMLRLESSSTCIHLAFLLYRSRSGILICTSSGSIVGRCRLASSGLLLQLLLDMLLPLLLLFDVWLLLLRLLLLCPSARLRSWLQAAAGGCIDLHGITSFLLLLLLLWLGCLLLARLRLLLDMASRPTTLLLLLL